MILFGGISNFPLELLLDIGKFFRAQGRHSC